jgi:hypothetical protein
VQLNLASLSRKVSLGPGSPEGTVFTFACGSVHWALTPILKVKPHLRDRAAMLHNGFFCVGGGGVDAAHCPVAEDVVLLFIISVKPKFPFGGFQVLCPHCRGSFIYQRRQLVYQY